MKVNKYDLQIFIVLLIGWILSISCLLSDNRNFNIFGLTLGFGMILNTIKSYENIKCLFEDLRGKSRNENKFKLKENVKDILLIPLLIHIIAWAVTVYAVVAHDEFIALIGGCGIGWSVVKIITTIKDIYQEYKNYEIWSKDYKDD